MANVPLKSLKFPGLENTYTVPQIDTTLGVSGAIPDSKIVGDEIESIKSDLTDDISGLNNQLNALGFSVVDGALNVTYTEE